MARSARKRTVHLNRALSKLGMFTRSQANDAILSGRVSVDGRVVRDPGRPVDLARTTIAVDDVLAEARPWRTLLVHKPRGVVTTRRDPAGRPTVYDVVGEPARSLVPVGRLDLATSGLLLLTSDTEWAAWVTDPANHVARLYVVVARGRVTDADALALEQGVVDRGERLHAHAVTLRKASARESHLIVELNEGKNREVRRLFEVIGHSVSRLKRVAFGSLTLDDLAPGRWREVSVDELRAAFPDAPLQRPRPLRQARRLRV